jgi:ornithine cyclodeaminase/alanine dehydrogenase
LEKNRPNSALLISRKEVETVFTMKDAIEAVEDAYREGGLKTAVIPPRIRIDMERYKGNILIMPAYLTAMGALGTKLVTTHLDNSKFNMPTVIGTIILNDPKTGFPIAIMDGTYITATRTGAAGAVAAKYLSRKEASTVTIVGTGVQGRSQAIGLCEVRRIKKLLAFDADQKRCEQYVDEMNKLIDVEIVRTDNLEKAVRDSDIVVTATPSSNPVVKGEWLAEGCHVTGIGSHSPDARELDENVFRRASKVVLDTWDAKRVGDINYPISKGMLEEKDLYGEIGEIVAGKKAGRTSDKEITVFKSVGTAMVDVSTAFRAYQNAMAKGVGKSIDLWGI